MLASLLLVFSFFLGSTFPPIGEERKYEGAVVLENGEVITGSFYFDEKRDLLYRKKENGLKVYPPYELQSFYFYDSAQNINRKFIMLPLSRPGYHPYRLYEVVVRGEVKVLRKRKDLDRPVQEERLQQHHAHNYYYFVLFEGKLLDIQQFASEVYPVLVKEEGAGLRKHLKDKDLNVHHAPSAIWIIQEYNKLRRKAKPDFLLF